MAVPEPIDIVLVGDLVQEGASRPTLFDWDNPTWPEVEQLVEWFFACGRRAEIVPSVKEFVSTAADYENKIVFPLWRGGASRSRTSIVPAVCETYGLFYIGADAFSQGVCQDKSLSKHYFRAVGLDTPPDVVVRDLSMDRKWLGTLDQFQFPVVVKPLSSACSIGVDDVSLCADVGAVVARVRQLIEQGLGPVICEPFVTGDEISFCVIESGGRIDLRCISAYGSEAGKCPFRDRLFTHEAKIAPEQTWQIGCYSGEVANDVWTKVEDLITHLGPFDLFRVDGRITDGHFTAIEVTPDIHLGLESAFLGGFHADGTPPWTVLDAVVSASLRNGTRGKPRRLDLPNGIADSKASPTLLPESD